MAKFGLIGYPISHSKSPALFMAGYPDYNHTYELLEERDLLAAINKFTDSDLQGVNVTAPFKDAVLEFTPFPDRIVSLLGSANVLIKGPEFSKEYPMLRSFNTDYYGVKNTVAELLDGDGGCYAGADRCTDAERSLLEEVKNVLVVGAGGAGKAAALAMHDMGYNVVLANRSADKAGRFAEKIGVEYAPLERLAECVESADMIIYALSFMLDGFDKYDFRGKVIFEANYANPLLSPDRGVESGLYISGKKWLFHQAIPAFELFTGEAPNVVLMRGVIGLL